MLKHSILENSSVWQVKQLFWGKNDEIALESMMRQTLINKKKIVHENKLIIQVFVRFVRKKNKWMQTLLHILVNISKERPKSSMTTHFFFFQNEFAECPRIFFSKKVTFF